MANLNYLKNRDKPIIVYGLGVSGTAVASALRSAGVPLSVWDDSEEIRSKFADEGYRIENPIDQMEQYSTLIPAAGIPPSHAVIQRAKELQIPILSDIDCLFHAAPNAHFIGITGTNGKSTVTALIAHIFQSADKAFEMGGNIGRPAAALPTIEEDGYYILELSSYQLAITPSAIFDTAVCLNITADDHLAWHGTFSNYVAAKKRIFRPRQDRETKQTAVLVSDNPANRTIAQDLKLSERHDVIMVSHDPTNGSDHIAAHNQALFERGEKKTGFKAPALPGPHNEKNIAAAVAVARSAGIDFTVITKAIETFGGLPHRQELVGRIDQVTFVNDSKATNISAVAPALSAYDSIHLIAGGKAKAGTHLSDLGHHFDRVKQIYLIGDAAEAFASDIDGDIPYLICGTMEQAVEAAYENARALTRATKEEQTVLLSPACASFDQYQSFTDRGDHFKAIVNDISCSSGTKESGQSV